MIENNNEMLPFENYPDQGRMLIGRVRGSNCRHGYGLEFMQLTKQTTCAYCGTDLATTYESWLTMALDHVVPRDTCVRLQVCEEWYEDYSNRVLSCTACNTFGNRYQPEQFECPSTLEAFYHWRDSVFIARRKNILEKHKEERAYFDQKLWIMTAS
ncbi:MAG: hypothetical protein LCI00_17365 [Chloroflexi bacterium]|nr:hypothetical protein [Chloroflexota bacterium]MCC6896684.1 hypothetical protein [Anaerolineae bacterium]